MKEEVMSLDATVWDVTRNDGELKLWLKGREPDGIAGQSRLIVAGTCQLAERLVNQDIWAGGSGPIKCGDVTIGERVGCSGCVLFNYGIKEAVGLPAE